MAAVLSPRSSGRYFPVPDRRQGTTGVTGSQGQLTNGFQSGAGLFQFLLCAGCQASVHGSHIVPGVEDDRRNLRMT